MTTWNDDELARTGATEELQLASAWPDGTLRRYVTMWVVRAGDELYVRSADGSDNPWYRRATTAGIGRIRGGGGESDVAFADPADLRRTAQPQLGRGSGATGSSFGAISR